MTVEEGLNPDFLDLLLLFRHHGVEFVVVGAHALAAQGIPRATGDLDLFVRPDDANARRVVAALAAFGAPLAQHHVSSADFARPGNVYQLGLPPRRIDVLTSISGVEFSSAWNGRIDVNVAGGPIAFLGRAELIQNKTAAARPKDLLDVQRLRELEALKTP